MASCIIVFCVGGSKRKSVHYFSYSTVKVWRVLYENSYSTESQYSTRGGSAGIRILYTYVTSSGNIRYDNQSYMVVVQWKSCARQQILVPSPCSKLCLYANDLSFKIWYFRWSRVHTAVKTPVTASVSKWERCKSQVQQCHRQGEGRQQGQFAPCPHCKRAPKQCRTCSNKIRSSVTFQSSFFKVARSPVFSRSTNLESKLIEFLFSRFPVGIGNHWW